MALAALSNSPEALALLTTLANDAYHGISKRRRNANRRNRARQVMNAPAKNMKPQGRIAMNSAPVAFNASASTTGPKFRSATGKYVVSNREYVADVLSTAGNSFDIASYPVQPGLATSFPWLSSIANTHQKYKMLKLKFTFISTSATSDKGLVGMAYALDPLDPTPTGDSQLFQYPGTKEESIWSKSVKIVDCSKMTTLFTRSGFVSGSDLKTYDFGKVFVATSNSSVDGVVGKLFVDYELELLTPKPAVCPAAVSRFTGSGSDDNIFGFATGDFVELAGSTVIASTGFAKFNDTGLVIGADDPCLNLMAPGIYLVIVRVQGAASSGNLTTDVARIGGDAVIETLHTLSITTGNIRVDRIFANSPSTVRYLSGNVGSLAATTVTIAAHNALPIQNVPQAAVPA